MPRLSDSGNAKKHELSTFLFAKSSSLNAIFTKSPPVYAVHLLVKSADDAASRPRCAASQRDHVTMTKGFYRAGVAAYRSGRSAEESGPHGNGAATAFVCPITVS